MPAWPDYAKLLVEGYSEKPDYGPLRDQMDSGIAFQRARYSLPIVQRAATIAVFSDADKAAFDGWFGTDLAGGVLWFDWTVPRTARVVQARIIASTFQWGAPAGRIWKGTCQIETIGR